MDKHSATVFEDIKPRIKDILLYGVQNHPRAIQQAISSFQSQWVVVKYRGLEAVIIPEILMTLALLPRNVFDAIFRCPYYYFYLHALATGKSNNECTSTQLEELYEMGVPKDTVLEQYDKLSELLNKFLIPDKFDYDDLVSHLTIQSKPVSDESQEQSSQARVKAGGDLSPIWETLNSNDPARIFQSNRDRGDEVLNLYNLQTSSTLTEAIDLSFQNQEKLADGTYNKVESAIIAAGLIGNANVVFLLEELLMNSQTPLNIQLRALYALSHHAARNTGQTHASNVLLTFAMNVNNRLHARVCAIRLLRYCPIDPSQAKRILALLEISAKKPGILSNKTLESAIEAKWWESLMELIEPQRFELAAFIHLCERPRSLSETLKPGKEQAGHWPIRSEIVDRLKQAALESDEYGENAFKLLRNHEDKEKSFGWLSDLSIRCDQQKSKMKKRGDLSKLQFHCWSAMQMLQLDLLPNWMADCWESVLDYIMKNNWPDEMIGFIPALLGTRMKNAVAIIEKNSNKFPAGLWKQTVLDNLLKLSSDKLDPEIAKYAGQVYTNLE